MTTVNKPLLGCFVSKPRQIQTTPFPRGKNASLSGLLPLAGLAPNLRNSMLSRQDVTDSTSHCVCTPCYYSKHCKNECVYFKEYVNTGSPEKRKQQLIIFKQEQAEWRESA